LETPGTLHTITSDAKTPSPTKASSLRQTVFPLFLKHVDCSLFRARR
jgi:hypothetical protein